MAETKYTTVAELLESPERYCGNRGYASEDADGLACQVRSPDAVAWTIPGALEFIYGDGEAYNEARKKLLAVIGETIWLFMARSSHAEVLDAVRRAGI